MGVVLRAACSGLHPCPLRFDCSVLRPRTTQFTVRGAPVFHRRLAVCVVSASRLTGVPKGLSRMRGNSHVRFLEGWAGAIPSGHSTEVGVSLARNRRSPKRPSEPRPSAVRPVEDEVAQNREAYLATRGGPQKVGDLFLPLLGGPRFGKIG